MVQKSKSLGPAPIKMHRIYLGLGSNIGNRLEHLVLAVKSILSLSSTIKCTLSSIYETKPVGYTNQADFLNSVIEIETTLIPEELLQEIQGIENDLGRQRAIRWGPRTLDIDILLFDDLQFSLEF